MKEWHPPPPAPTHQLPGKESLKQAKQASLLALVLGDADACSADTDLDDDDQQGKLSREQIVQAIKRFRGLISQEVLKRGRARQRRGRVIAAGAQNEEDASPDKRNRFYSSGTASDDTPQQLDAVWVERLLQILESALSAYDEEKGMVHESASQKVVDELVNVFAHGDDSMIDAMVQLQEVITSIGHTRLKEEDRIIEHTEKKHSPAGIETVEKDLQGARDLGERRAARITQQWLNYIAQEVFQVAALGKNQSLEYAGINHLKYRLGMHETFENLSDRCDRIDELTRELEDMSKRKGPAVIGLKQLKSLLVNHLEGEHQRRFHKETKELLSTVAKAKAEVAHQLQETTRRRSRLRSELFSHLAELIEKQNHWHPRTCQHLEEEFGRLRAVREQLFNRTAKAVEKLSKLKSHLESSSQAVADSFPSEKLRSELEVKVDPTDSKVISSPSKEKLVATLFAHVAASEAAGVLPNRVLQVSKALIEDPPEKALNHAAGGPRDVQDALAIIFKMKNQKEVFVLRRAPHLSAKEGKDCLEARLAHLKEAFSSEAYRSAVGGNKAPALKLLKHAEPIAKLLSATAAGTGDSDKELRSGCSGAEVALLVMLGHFNAIARVQRGSRILALQLSIRGLQLRKQAIEVVMKKSMLPEQQSMRDNARRIHAAFQTLSGGLAFLHGKAKSCADEASRQMATYMKEIEEIVSVTRFLAGRRGLQVNVERDLVKLPGIDKIELAAEMAARTAPMAGEARKVDLGIGAFADLPSLLAAPISLVRTNEHVYLEDGAAQATLLPNRVIETLRYQQKVLRLHLFSRRWMRLAFMPALPERELNKIQAGSQAAQKVVLSLLPSEARPSWMQSSQTSSDSTSKSRSRASSVAAAREGVSFLQTRTIVRRVSESDIGTDGKLPSHWRAEKSKLHALAQFTAQLAQCDGTASSVRSDSPAAEPGAELNRDELDASLRHCMSDPDLQSIPPDFVSDLDARWTNTETAWRRMSTTRLEKMQEVSSATQKQDQYQSEFEVGTHKTYSALEGERRGAFLNARGSQGCFRAELADMEEESDMGDAVRTARSRATFFHWLATQNAGSQKKNQLDFRRVAKGRVTAIGASIGAQARVSVAASGASIRAQARVSIFADLVGRQTLVVNEPDPEAKAELIASENSDLSSQSEESLDAGLRTGEQLHLHRLGRRSLDLDIESTQEGLEQQRHQTRWSELDVHCQAPCERPQQELKGCTDSRKPAKNFKPVGRRARARKPLKAPTLDLSVTAASSKAPGPMWVQVAGWKQTEREERMLLQTDSVVKRQAGSFLSASSASDSETARRDQSGLSDQDLYISDAGPMQDTPDEGGQDTQPEENSQELSQEGRLRLALADSLPERSGSGHLMPPGSLRPPRQPSTSDLDKHKRAPPEEQQETRDPQQQEQPEMATQASKELVELQPSTGNDESQKEQDIPDASTTPFSLLSMGLETSPKFRRQGSKRGGRQIRRVTKARGSLERGASNEKEEHQDLGDDEEDADGDVARNAVESMSEERVAMIYQAVQRCNQADLGMMRPPSAQSRRFREQRPLSGRTFTAADAARQQPLRGPPGTARRIRLCQRTSPGQAIGYEIRVPHGDPMLDSSSESEGRQDSQLFDEEPQSGEIPTSPVEECREAETLPAGWYHVLPPQQTPRHDLSSQEQVLTSLHQVASSLQQLSVSPEEAPSSPTSATQTLSKQHPSSPRQISMVAEHFPKSPQDLAQDTPALKDRESGQEGQSRPCSARSMRSRLSQPSRPCSARTPFHALQAGGEAGTAPLVDALCVTTRRIDTPSKSMRLAQRRLVVTTELPAEPASTFADDHSPDLYAPLDAHGQATSRPAECETIAEEPVVKTSVEAGLGPPRAGKPMTRRGLLHLLSQHEPSPSNELDVVSGREKSSIRQRPVWPGRSRTLSISSAEGAGESQRIRAAVKLPQRHGMPNPDQQPITVAEAVMALEEGRLRPPPAPLSVGRRETVDEAEWKFDPDVYATSEQPEPYTPSISSANAAQNPPSSVFEPEKTRLHNTAAPGMSEVVRKRWESWRPCPMTHLVGPGNAPKSPKLPPAAKANLDSWPRQRPGSANLSQPARTPTSRPPFGSSAPVNRTLVSR
eukprot:TRINITY_DN28637_c0_g1_i1.p1 TRINITY_DN28637_c0_g1~~TRINITY_DN28637_c0_g1_i1.p1  ORF type:complete len:2112 (+),score=327.33 TRINITY_DN28637_c0_g1_i1:52-6387(+)